MSLADFLRGIRDAGTTGGVEECAVGEKTLLGLGETLVDIKEEVMSLSRTGSAKIEEGNKALSISLGTKSRTLMGVTKESLPAKEEGATTSSQEVKESGTLLETDAKGKECS